MADLTPLQGELQTQIMATLWRIEAGTVEQVREALPPRYRGAYTTVQTVLNRLAERGLLRRAKQGHAFVYLPQITESDYVSTSIRRALDGASREARTSALAELIGSLDHGQLDELQRLARKVETKKRR